MASYDDITLPALEEESGVYIGIPKGSAAEKGFTIYRPAPDSVYSGGPVNPADFVTSEHRGPRYKIGDELIPASKDPNDIFELQRVMHDAGLIGKFIPGRWDNTSKSAFKEILGMANAAGTTWEEMLMSIAEVGGTTGRGSGSGSGALPALLPNPADVKKLGNETARELIGAELTPEQADAFVNSFMGAMQPHTAPRSMDAPGGPYDAPSPQTYAEDYIKQSMPGEYGAHEQTKHFSAFMDMLGGL